MTFMDGLANWEKDLSWNPQISPIPPHPPPPDPEENNDQYLKLNLELIFFKGSHDKR